MRAVNLFICVYVYTSVSPLAADPALLININCTRGKGSLDCNYDAITIIDYRPITIYYGDVTFKSDDKNFTPTTIIVVDVIVVACVINQHPTFIERV